MAQHDRVKEKYYGLNRKNFDNELLKMVKQKSKEVASRLEKAYEETDSNNSVVKVALLMVTVVFELKVRELTRFKEELVNTFDAASASQLIGQLGSAEVSPDEVNAFSDFFVGIPVKAGKSQRKDLALQILKDGNYSDLYKQNLLVQDRFGNTMFSMAMSALSEEERVKFRGLGLIKIDENQVKAGQRDTFYQSKVGELKRKKLEKKETMDETPIWKFLSDPKRDLLRSQLKLMGMPICHKANYPRDPAQQADFYRDLVQQKKTHCVNSRCPPIFCEVISTSQIAFGSIIWQMSSKIQ